VQTIAETHMNFPEPTRHTGAAVCGTAAHLWLQQLPFVVVQMQLAAGTRSSGR
jgi:hypothetical protein